MKKVIIRLNFQQLKNETHVQCHENINGIFQKYGPDAMGFGPLYPLYSASFSHELLALDFIRKSEYTVKIHEQDRSRDRIFRGFVEIAQAAMHHFDPVTVAAGTLLYDIFKHYGNIARKTLDDETAAINDLLRELQHPACEDALITLNATAWRGRLQRENEDFAALMTDRYVEVSGQTPYRMVTTRTDTDRYYHVIVNQLKNQEMAGNHVADALIKELNAVLERFKHILAQEIGERIPPPPPNNEQRTTNNEQYSVN